MAASIPLSVALGVKYEPVAGVQHSVNAFKFVDYEEAAITDFL